MWQDFFTNTGAYRMSPSISLLFVAKPAAACLPPNMIYQNVYPPSVPPVRNEPFFWVSATL